MKCNRLLSIAFLFSLIGCGQTPVEIGNGYYHFRTNSDNLSIAKKIGDIYSPVVDSNIIEYSVENIFVVGLRKQPKFDDGGEEYISKKYGYFVLNMSTGVLLEGLAKTDAHRLVYDQ